MISSKYDLVIIYNHKASRRIVKIDDYFPNYTTPIFNTHTEFFVSRRSKIIIDPTKELYNYGYSWSDGVFNIPDTITNKRIKEIELEKDKLDVLEELWLDILTGIEGYKAAYFLNPLIRQIKDTDKLSAIELKLNHPNLVPAFSAKTFEEVDMEDQLTTKGLDELCKRCYIMYSDLANKIKESETPYETFKQARRSYFYPIFEQTGTELFSESS